MTTQSQIHWRQSNTQNPGEPFAPLQANGCSLVVEKYLPKKALFSLTGDHTGERIVCLEGMLWITQVGSQEDILVRDGDTFMVTHKGTILIEGLVESRLEIRRSALANHGWIFSVKLSRNRRDG